MAVFRWLLKEAPDEWNLNRSGMYSVVPMHILKLQVDYLLQIVSLDPLPTTKSPLTSARLDDTSIQQIMRQPRWMFGRVGYDPPYLLHTDTTLHLPDDIIYEVKRRRRLRCDTCRIRNLSCVKEPGKNVCSTCYHSYGRPTCAWTYGIFSMNRPAKSATLLLPILEPITETVDLALCGSTRRSTSNQVKTLNHYPVVDRESILVNIVRNNDDDDSDEGSEDHNNQEEEGIEDGEEDGSDED